MWMGGNRTKGGRNTKFHAVCDAGNTCHCHLEHVTKRIESGDYRAAMKFLMLRSKRVAIRRQSLRRQHMRLMMLLSRNSSDSAMGSDPGAGQAF